MTGPFARYATWIAGGLCLLLVVYQMVASQVLLLATVPYLTIHMTLCFLITLLTTASVKSSRIYRWWCLALVLLTVGGAVYILLFWPDIQDRAYFNTFLDLAVGVMLIVVALETTRQAFGWFLPVLSVAVVAYGFLGAALPPPFTSQALPLKQTIANLSVGFEGGIYAFLHISANFLFLFVLFGGVLNATGASKFFMSLGELAMRTIRGGAAMMAVVASAGVGSVTGSAAANVAVTGPFTIPLMKKAGIKAHEAGGIEAAASNGGQIMPPIMGMTAFAMSGLTGIPYLKIVVMAIIPAVIYFFTVGLYVYFLAGRRGMHKPPKTEAVKIDYRELALSSINFLVPIGVIVVLLVEGYSVNFVAFWAILVCVAVSLIRKKTRPSLKQFVDGFISGAKQGAAIGCSVACVGLILSTLMMSGLGVKLIAGIEEWSGGSLIMALFLIWVISIVLGMSGASLTAYIIVSVFTVPALQKMGVPMEQGHFFAMVVSVFAFITPPVAMVSLIAAKVADAKYIPTAIESTKAAFAGFLVPFMFIFCPIMLLQPGKDLWFEILGLAAIVVFFVAIEISFVGFYLSRCRWYERAVLAISAGLLFVFLSGKSYIALSIGLACFVAVSIRQWCLKKRRAPATPA